ALELLDKIKMKSPDIEIFISGELYRKSEIIEKISFITSAKAEEISEFCNDLDIKLEEKLSGPQILRGKISGLYSVEFLLSEKDFVVFDRMVRSISGYHFMQLKDAGLKCRKEYKSSSEENIYHSLGIQLIPEETREFPDLNFWKMKESAKELIKVSDMKGMLHCHSTYSDGRHSLKEMAQACIDRGYEYLGICDHSKSAFFYANGLFEHRVLQQQEEIDLLNKELAPFKIFKGIESDILADGNLDYENEFLNNFDFVVASIHSGLTMDIEKAMSRLLTAIMNPHTTILGHLTGRILLARKGYPVDHKTIIDACAEHKVGIEINAHQSRLDIDWRWVAYAVEKGVMISINPDAHSTDGLDMTEFGVIMARKAGLTSDKVLNTKSTNDIEKYFKNLKTDRGI
ncbi:MAG: PHP domain-containing protein, partial [Cyclobacteriaceae bacterium]|nr:PHP domain-containing protein [Cyclobacteriaceae bacterium]